MRVANDKIDGIRTLFMQLRIWEERIISAMTRNASIYMGSDIGIPPVADGSQDGAAGDGGAGGAAAGRGRAAGRGSG